MDQEVPLSPSEAETSWLDYYEIAYSVSNESLVSQALS